MATPPKYVQRIARLPQVFEHLLAHPDGLPLADLADRVDVPANQLREDLLAFFAADVSPDLLLGLTRPGVLEFLGPDGDEADPNDAERVRITDPRNVDELGVELVDASELALIYTAARSLLEIEPEDPDLAAAVDVLAEAMLGEESRPGTDARVPWHHSLDTISEGQRRRQRVSIVYSRAWEAGVRERVIEPYRLVRTRRGWEVDAGPLDEHGVPRTFLLSNVREARLLDEPFEVPGDVTRTLEENRATQVVRVELPQSARWAADMYAETVTVVRDDELTAVLDVELLPPLRHRLGLLLLASGADARVLGPDGLEGCRGELAEALLEHHRAPESP